MSIHCDISKDHRKKSRVAMTQAASLLGVDLNFKAVDKAIEDSENIEALKYYMQMRKHRRLACQEGKACKQSKVITNAK